MISKLYSLLALFLFTFVFIGIPRTTKAQNHTVIDSMLTVLDTDTNQIKAFHTGYRYFRKDNASGLIYTRKAITRFEKQGKLDLAAKGNYYHSKFIEGSSNPDSLFFYMQRAISLAEQGTDGILKLSLLKQYIGVSNQYHKKIDIDSISEVYLGILGNQETTNDFTDEQRGLYRVDLYKLTGEYLLIMDKMSEALDRFEVAQEELSLLDTANQEVKAKVAYISFGIGYQFYKTGYMGRSKTILLKAEKVMQTLDPSSQQANVFNILGAIYKQESQPDSAMHYFRKALEVNQHFNLRSNIAGCYENIGIVYKDMGDLNQAMASFQQSLEIREGMNRKDILVGLYVNMSSVFILQENYKKSEKYLLEALAMSENMPGKMKSRIAAYQNLSETYAKQGNYEKALESYRSFKQLSDSLSSQRIHKEQVAFDKKLELSEKNARIEIGKQKNKVLTAENRRVRTANFAMGGGLLLLAFMIYMVYRLGKQRRENERLVFESEKKEQQSEILKLLANNEVTSMNSFMKGQEKERARIASDLHDRLGSLLSTVKLHFNLLKVNIEEVSAKHTEPMERTIELLDSAVEEVRSVSKNLTQGVITQFGLLAAVENLQDSINQSGRMNIEVVEAGFDTRLESEIEINLFRVIQEMVTNAIKHAEADEMIIQFVQSEDSINIIVEDNGKGFDPSGIKSNGLGLSNMYNRINEIGASYNLDTSIGNGTTYVIELKL